MFLLKCAEKHNYYSLKWRGCLWLLLQVVHCTSHFAVIVKIGMLKLEALFFNGISSFLSSKSTLQDIKEYFTWCQVIDWNNAYITAQLHLLTIALLTTVPTLLHDLWCLLLDRVWSNHNSLTLYLLYNLSFMQPLYSNAHSSQCWKLVPNRAQSTVHCSYSASSSRVRTRKSVDP
jgi:hypothetical protein